MGALHIVSKSPYASNALDDCLRACGADATLLLIEDAVIAALTGSEWAQKLAAGGHRVYVLDADCAARAISDRLADKFNAIDYARFVQLCCEHTPIVSWY